MSNQEPTKTVDQRPTTSSNTRFDVKVLVKKCLNHLIKFISYIDFPSIFAILFVLEMVFLFPISGIEECYLGIAHNRYVFFYRMVIIFVCEMAAFLLIRLLIRLIAGKAYRSLFHKSFKASVQNLKDRIKIGWKAFCSSFNAIDTAVLLYLGFVLISALLAEDKQVAFKGHYERNNGFLIQLCYVITYFIISRFFKTHKLGLYWYCLGGTMTSVFLLLHHYGYDPFDIAYAATSAFVGPMGNIDFTSYFLTIAVVLSAAIYITEQYLSIDDNGYIILGCFAVTFWAQLRINVDSGTVADVVALVAALLLLLNSSRRIGRLLTLLSVGMGTAIFKRMAMDCDHFQTDFGKKGWLMLALELVLIALTICVNEGRIKLNFSPKTIRITVASVCGAAVIVLLVAAYRETDTSSMIYQMGQIIFYHKFEDDFGSGRGFIWRRSMQLLKNHPLLGIGPDSFEQAFMSRFKEDCDLDYGGQNVVEAHNEYLHLWVCSGITALASYLAFLGFMIVRGCRRAEKDPLLACCVLGVIAYAVHAFFMPALPLHTPLMWILFGLTGSRLRSDERAVHTTLPTHQ